jgi:Domain of unknown function (DUF1707)
MSTSPPESRGLRISDADRARAAERLQVAMAEGRITVVELEERLAFTQADNPHPVVEVELEIAAGSVKLLLPAGATADVDDLLAALGEIKCRVPSRPRTGAPHFVVRGRCGLGSVVVRRRRRVADYFT